MKDPEGRGYFERRREKKIIASDAEAQTRRDELRQAMRSKSAQNMAKLTIYTSLRSLVKTMLPQLLIGVILGYVEYVLVGLLYTIVSIVVYIPLIYLYSKTLRERNGVYIMVPTSNFRDWERLFVSNEIWSLVDKKTHLTMEEGKINGRITYWCIDVKYLEGSNIPYYVEVAWRHYNPAKFGMFVSVLNDAVKMVEDLLLEVAKLRKLGRVEAITEATRQTEATIEAITSAHRDSIMDVVRKQNLTQDEADVYQKEVSELIENPEYIRELVKKQKEDGERRAATT